MVDGHIKWCRHFGKQLAVPQKDIELTCDPEIPLLGIYTRKILKYAHTKTHTYMFIAAFLIVKKWKYPNCHQLIVDMQNVYLYHKILFTNKRGEVQTYVTTKMNLERGDKDGGVEGCGAHLRPQIYQKSIYVWNSSHRLPAERLQKISCKQS